MVVGTRPEIIKMAPVVSACDEMSIPYNIIHTGQHYSYEMDSLIIGDLNFPNPKHNLHIGSGSHAEETAKALVGLERLFKQIRPDVVLVQGDTNSTLAGALAAAKLHIPVGHVEAGLRSFDRQMPEETNRILTDHLSDFLFAPTEWSAKNLLGEGVSSDKITVTGNTIVDVVRYISKLEAHKPPDDSRGRDEFALLTLHREENVDDEPKLRGILEGVELAARKHDLKVIFPAHPRTTRRLQEYRIDIPDPFEVKAPVGYLDFLRLEKSAQLIFTDSGGVQEEACVLGTPCVTLRTSTERPETIEAGANCLCGTGKNEILRGATKMMNSDKGWENPFGDGKAGRRIVEFISRVKRGMSP